MGNGVGAFSRFDGKVFALPKTDAFSAAGIGFYLTTSEPVLAGITPQGNYNFSYTAFHEDPFARTSGGMGITIYTDTETTPTLSRQPVLWNASGATLLSGAKGGGRIADAASPAFGFGTVPLAPALFNMVPDSRYLVWVWCWQTARHDAFFAQIGFSMPLVTVDASPPIVIH